MICLISRLLLGMRYLIAGMGYGATGIYLSLFETHGPHADPAPEKNHAGSFLWRTERAQQIARNICLGVNDRIIKRYLFDIGAAVQCKVSESLHLQEKTSTRTLHLAARRRTHVAVTLTAVKQHLQPSPLSVARNSSS